MNGLEPSSRTTIARRILTRLAPAGPEIRIADVRIGLGYTAVMLADSRAGVAYTFRERAKGGCSVFTGVRPIAGRTAAELLPLVESRDVVEAAVGLACANALANIDRAGYIDGDVLDHLDLGPADDVAMIGLFAPLVGPIRRRARSLTVVELIDEPDGELRPRQEAAETLRRCHVALITATSIINGSVDCLLEAAAGCRQTAILGASTPLLPEVFAGTHVTILSGVIVHNPSGILQIVSEGGGMRFFGPHIRKVSLTV